VNNTDRLELLFLKAKAATTPKTDKLQVAFEKSLTRKLYNDYRPLAARAVRAATSTFKGQFTKSEAKRIKAAVGDVMERFGKEAAPVIIKQTEIFYRANVRGFLNETKISKAEGLGASIDFSQRDKQAVEALSKISVHTAGSYFPDQLADKVSEVVDDVILVRGLPVADAAVVLEAEVAGSLGVAAKAAIPTRFHTNPQAYFSILAQNASVMASSTGRMIAMKDSGVEKYQIYAVIDKRTTNICRRLDGKVFAVDKGMSAVDDLIDSSTKGDIKGLMPFSKDDSVPKWANSGQGFPPYHHKCRTQVIPV
jgi:hypothetical protein